ncbi:Transcriptional regulator, MarR family protein [Minicystis rosea]|nr:Transcriptional regulator, MarR family protein [Minicystis rosea]
MIKRVQIGHHRSFDAALESRGLSLAQWKALREIDANPGMPQLALADRALISAQAFGTLVTRLIARGLVKRSPGEGRATVHALTPKGKTALAEGREVWAAVLEQSFEPLTKVERAELTRLMKKVLREG